MRVQGLDAGIGLAVEGFLADSKLLVRLSGDLGEMGYAEHLARRSKSAQKTADDLGDASADPLRSVGKARLNDERGYAEVEVNRAVLNEVIRQRLEETLHLVRQRLPSGAVEAIGAGIFLTGGTSLMRGFSELAFEVFGRDIYRPELPEISGIQASFKDPRYATSIGLIRYAQILETERAAPSGIFGKITRLFWPFGR